LTRNLLSAFVLNNAPKTVLKKADETISSDTTLHADNTLKIIANANKVYSFTIILQTLGNSSADIKWNFTLPAGASGSWTKMDDATIDDIEDTVAISIFETEVFPIEYVCHVAMGATAGDIQFVWAQNVSNAGNTTIKAGSWISYWEI